MHTNQLMVCWDKLPRAMMDMKDCAEIFYLEPTCASGTCSCIEMSCLWPFKTEALSSI